jgi:putative NIF3 family GTP cyclohydrolase 1 type 2
VKAGLDTLITGEADYPTEVKARELGLNLILGGHRETEVFGVRKLAAWACLSVRGFIRLFKAFSKSPVIHLYAENSVSS